MPKATPSQPPLSGKILVVEDNPAFAKQICGLLTRTRSRHEVVSCPTGKEALDVLDQPRVRLNLALVDLGLPDMSGLEVIRAVRRRFDEVPILVISVITSERSLLEAIRAGARGYILKGETEDALAKSIEDVLAGNYPISPLLARTLFKMAGSPDGQIDPQEFRLSPRELETLTLLSRGHSYKDVAQLMNIGLSTVQSNVRGLYRKLEVNSQTQAITKARESGLIP